MILEDYHCISQEQIHKAVTFVISHMPENLHLVVSTRIDPAIPMANLRAKNELNEFRASDLCFSFEDAFVLFNDIMSLNLPNKHIQMLESLTEGWVAGLKLAALSMRDSENIDDAIYAFAGDDRHIVDYLTEEVLNLQPEHIRQFLYQTAILKRLSESLCNAVTKRKDSQKILEYLEKENLFIVPLDNKRNWYRYHHLFADLLLARAGQSGEYDVVALHERACEWFAQNEFLVDAIEHALSVNNYETAAQLIEQHATELLTRGEMNLLLKWVKMLPEHVVSRRPWFSVHHAWILVFAGDLDKAEALLNGAETLGKKRKSTAEDRDLIGSKAAIRSYISVIRGEFLKADQFAQTAEKKLSQTNHFVHSVVHWGLGMSQRACGWLSKAENSFTEVVKRGDKIANIWTIITGLTDLALVHQARGEISKAVAVYQKALNKAVEKGGQEFGYMARLEAGLADALCEQNRLKEALQHINQSIQKLDKWMNANHFVYSYNVLSRILQGQGKFFKSMEALNKVEKVIHKSPVVIGLQIAHQKNRIRQWTAANEAGAIETWIKEMGMDSGRDMDLAGAPERNRSFLAVLAGALLAIDRPDDALKLLQSLIEYTEKGEKIYDLIELYIFQALAFKAKNRQERSLKSLHESLKLAEPGGCVRIFLDQGVPMERLLEKILDIKTDVSANYIKSLITAFRLSSIINVKDELVEQLTNREMEVLQHIAAGLTNKEITQALFISLATVKTHTKNIYNKFNVHNRIHAIKKAKEIGLLH
ncbi:LuxR C-terminal-related transcriptional regulator [Desulfobacula sp.]|uniref:LuxR C-terminal-related transcriptional regulator n=1 Tax=Desulfobacula sp. TaxID=2593537 RepID=UPI00263115E0|nr:LuxR C-terminal-related transcriptional regulator [Desulfobacula sp.]